MTQEEIKAFREEASQIGNALDSISRKINSTIKELGKTSQESFAGYKDNLSAAKKTALVLTKR